MEGDGNDDDDEEGDGKNNKLTGKLENIWPKEGEQYLSRDK